MAQRKRKLTEVEQVDKMLKRHGFHEVTPEEKKQPWYEQHLKQIELWKKEAAKPPAAVHEKPTRYGTKRNPSSKSKA